MVVTYAIMGLRNTLKELDIEVPTNIQKYLEQRESKIQTDFIAYETNLVDLMNESVDFAFKHCEEVTDAFVNDSEARKDADVAEMYTNAIDDVITNTMKEIETSKIPDSLKRVFIRKLIIKKDNCNSIIHVDVKAEDKVDE